MAGTDFAQWFWNERFWLPHNTTWADLRNTEEAIFPQASDLWMVLPHSAILYILRIVVERYDLIRFCSLGKGLCNKKFIPAVFWICMLWRYQWSISGLHNLSLTIHVPLQHLDRWACRARLKGRGHGVIFTAGPLWRISWRHCKICFRWFATFSFAFFSSRSCACCVNTIVTLPLIVSNMKWC